MKAKLKAFTLIELLIVVAIIAILAAIAVPNFLEARVRSQVSRVKADQRTYATALESYFVDYNIYPCTIDAIVPGLEDRCVNPVTNGIILEAWMYGLSSPISYLSSAVIAEPFNAKQGEALYEGCDIVDGVGSPIGGPCADRSERVPVYGYVSLPNDDIIAIFAPILLGLIAAQLPSLNINQQMIDGVIRKRWGLISPGPDTYFSYDRCLIDQPSAGDLCLYQQVADAFIDEAKGLYDPTNGTISRGEIVRHMGGISQ